MEKMRRRAASRVDLDETGEIDIPDDASEQIGDMAREQTREACSLLQGFLETQIAYLHAEVGCNLKEKLRNIRKRSFLKVANFREALNGAIEMLGDGVSQEGDFYE